MITVSAPVTIGAPHDDWSFIRSADRPAMSTVVLPLGKGAGGCGPAVGGIMQTCVSPTIAAGSFTMSTVGAPGPAMTPGCPVLSPKRAAGGMVNPLVDRDRGALHDAVACC